MTLIDLAKSLKEAWSAVFVSRYVAHLEDEVIRLRAENARLQIKYEQAVAPKPAAAPIKREVPTFTPVKTSWESYLQEQITLQEQEAKELSL